MQLGCIKNSNLKGCKTYEEVGILHCWRTIEAAWVPVPDEIYSAIYAYIMNNFSTRWSLNVDLNDETT